MSITVSNCMQICGSPLNDSKAKFLYSFPQENRFPSTPKPACSTPYYDLPSVRMARQAGIGYGGKFDFTQHGNKNPAPNHYPITSQIEQDRRKNQGKVFGIGRELMKTSGIIPLHAGKIPGPGTYENRSSLSKTSYSFRKRTALFDPILSQIQPVPGPGTYNPPQTVNEKGKYFVSKYKNSLAGLISPASSQRFSEYTPSAQVPGPGSYTPLNMAPDGKYFLSNIRSTQCRTFSHDMRRTISMQNLQTPGPGSYVMPSDFGHYESRMRYSEKGSTQANTPSQGFSPRAETAGAKIQEL